MTGKIHSLYHGHFVYPTASVHEIRAWNAETPNTYTLVVSTFDAQGNRWNPLRTFWLPYRGNDERHADD